MKNKIILVLALAGALTSPLTAVFAQGTAFTYQGRLNDGGNPANGSYDLRFIVYDSSAGGNQQGPFVTNSATTVSAGLFTVTLDFGNQFPDANRWLEISVRTNGAAAFFTLSPRQAMTPAPYAITAGNVTSNGLAAGTYGSAVTFDNANNSFSGSFTGNGANVTSVNAATLGGLGAANFWKTAGNTGTSPGANFLGTADNQPLVIRANNLQVMQFAYASNTVSGYSPNVIGGNSANTVSAGVVGATIGGGGVPGFFGPNAVTADFGTVVGGSGSSAQGRNAIAGGGVSSAGGQSSVAFGGFSQASGDYSVAMGTSTASGTNSTAFGYSKATTNYATAMGGSVASGDYATALGYSTAGGNYATAMGNSLASGNFATAMGESSASGDYATALGYANAYGNQSVALGGSFFVVTEADGVDSFAAGSGAKAAHDYCFVWNDGTGGLPYSSSAPNQFLIHANGGVGIGLTNPAAALHVASASGSPQFQITQNNAGDYSRLRMGVSGYQPWEIDVSPGATPQLQFWNSTERAYLDYNGNFYATSVNPTSDRNAKENFSRINPGEVLDKVTALPITRWNFKTDAGTEHIGPMAQDFHAAFSVGMDDKHIATVDEGGVALAAIQGLNEKVENGKQKAETQMQELKAENAELKARLKKLEQLMDAKTRETK